MMIRSRLKLSRWLSLFLLLFLQTKQANACICDSITEMNDSIYNESQIIFKGRVLSIKVNNEVQEIKFLVQEEFKDTEVGDTIIIHSLSEPGFCGIRLFINDIWYMCVSGIDDENKLWTSQCDRNINLTKKKCDLIGSSAQDKYLYQRYRSNKKRYKKEKKWLSNR